MSIEFRAVGKQFQPGVDAVRDVSFVVPTGSLTVLVGSSGCGKTTLLRMVNRMVEPTFGDVLIDGVSVRERNPVELRRSIGYVMQSGGLLPHKKVIEAIQTVPRLIGTPREVARTRAGELMDLVGLDRSLAERYPAELSGGQQQRVGVARALAADPAILLMDEPFGAVDPLVRADLQRELKSLQQRLGKTVLFVTHDIDEALLLGDQVIILQEGGTIAQKGTPADIMVNPASPFVEAFVGHHTRRVLTLRPDSTPPLVEDASGRILGVLAEDSPS